MFEYTEMENSPKESSNIPDYILLFFKGTKQQDKESAKPRMSTVEKRAFGSHMEEHKRQRQTRNAESCF